MIELGKLLENHPLTTKAVNAHLEKLGLITLHKFRYDPGHAMMQIRNYAEHIGFSEYAGTDSISDLLDFLEKHLQNQPLPLLTEADIEEMRWTDQGGGLVQGKSIKHWNFFAMNARHTVPTPLRPTMRSSIVCGTKLNDFKMKESQMNQPPIDPEYIDKLEKQQDPKEFKREYLGELIERDMKRGDELNVYMSGEGKGKSKFDGFTPPYAPAKPKKEYFELERLSDNPYEPGKIKKKK